jgi:hypothetical protein
MWTDVFGQPGAAFGVNRRVAHGDVLSANEFVAKGGV